VKKIKLKYIIPPAIVGVAFVLFLIGLYTVGWIVSGVGCVITGIIYKKKKVLDLDCAHLNRCNPSTCAGCPTYKNKYQD